MRKLIDLHIHTNISDGMFSPKEVIDEAYRNNASVISITDHDTIDAYTDEIFEYAKSKNIILIPGVEISAKAERSGVHILGYNFDINNRAFRAIKERKKRVEIRATKVGNNHFDYGILKMNDIIHFNSFDNEKIDCIITDVNWYKTIEELLTLEGTRYTLSSTNDFNEGVKSINSLNGYEEAIKTNGVYAIHIRPIN